MPKWDNNNSRGAPSLTAKVVVADGTDGHHDRLFHLKEDKVYIIADFMKSKKNFTPYSIHVWAIEYNAKRCMPWFSFGSLAHPILATNRYGRLGKFQEFLLLASTTDLISLFSFFVTAGLILLAIFIHDGADLVGLVLVSTHSTICCYLLWSHIKSRILHGRMRHNSGPLHDFSEHPPNGKVVIQTANNSFWILYCDKFTLRGLFGFHRLFKTGDPFYPPIKREHYQLPEHSILQVVKDAILYLAFTFFAFSKFTTQLAIAASYILITILYGIVPPPYICPGEFKTTSLFLPGLPQAHIPNTDLTSSEAHPRLAKTLWHCMRLLKLTDWVLAMGTVPDSNGWQAWLREANKNIDNDDWPAQAEKIRLVGNESEREIEDTHYAADPRPPTEE